MANLVCYKLMVQKIKFYLFGNHLTILQIFYIIENYV